MTATPMTLRQWIDIPPVWLAAFVAAAWVQGRYMAMGLSLAGGVTDLLGGRADRRRADPCGAGGL